MRRSTFITSSEITEFGRVRSVHATFNRCSLPARPWNCSLRKPKVAFNARDLLRAIRNDHYAVEKPLSE
jgi:hypothetical protein